MTHEHMNRVSVMYFELRNGRFQMQSDYGTFLWSYETEGQELEATILAPRSMIRRLQLFGVGQTDNTANRL